MKTIKSLLLVAAIAFSSVLIANTNPIETNPATTGETTVITKEVYKLLKNPGFLIDHDILASVKLTINKNNEIVVLSVDSEDETVKSYIKARLNYNQLPEAYTGNVKTFIVPVRLHIKLD